MFGIPGRDFLNEMSKMFICPLGNKSDKKSATKVRPSIIFLDMRINRMNFKWNTTHYKERQTNVSFFQILPFKISILHLK